MKKINSSPSSTSHDYIGFEYACRYSPSDTSFHRSDLNFFRLQNSTLDSFLCATEIISDLPKYKLNSHIECSVSQDEDGSFLIDCPALRACSSGDTRQEAVDNLKENIESLYEDLLENNDFSEDWLVIKRNLKSIIVR